MAALGICIVIVWHADFYCIIIHTLITSLLVIHQALETEGSIHEPTSTGYHCPGVKMTAQYPHLQACCRAEARRSESLGKVYDTILQLRVSRCATERWMVDVVRIQRTAL